MMEEIQGWGRKLCVCLFRGSGVRAKRAVWAAFCPLEVSSFDFSFLLLLFFLFFFVFPLARAAGRKGRMGMGMGPCCAGEDGGACSQ